MARFITFNGVTLYHPGALSKVDAANMAQVGQGVSGVVGIVGEADGGQPNTSSSPKVYEFTDPDAAVSVFKSGELAEAMSFLFNPANDVRIPGGAQKVLAVKTNQSTQSTKTFASQNLSTLSNALTVTSVDYGEHTDQISVEIKENALDNTRVDLVINDKSTGMKETITKAAGSPLLNIQYRGPNSPSVVAIGTLGTNSSDEATLLAATNTTNVVTGSFIKLTSGDYAGQIRRIVSISGTEGSKNITVYGDFSGLPKSGTSYEVIRGAIGPLPVTTDSTKSKVVIEGTSTAGSTSFKTDATGITHFGTGLGPSYIRVISGTGAGQIRRIQEHDTVAHTQAAGVATLNLAVDLTTALDSTSRIMLVNAGYRGAQPNGAVATVIGTKGAATQLILSVASGWGEPGSGITAVGTPGNLAYVQQYKFDLSSSISLSQLINRINTGGTVSTGFNKPSTFVDGDHGWFCQLGAGRSVALSSDRFDFVDAEVADDSTKWNSVDTVNNRVHALVDFNTSYSDTWGGTNDGTAVKNYRLLDSLQQLVDTINNQSSLCTATRSSENPNDGCGMADFTVSAVSLTGGAKGVTSASNISDAFDELLKYRHTTAVALFSDDTVAGGIPALHEQLKSHADSGSAGYKNEVDCIAAYKATSTSALFSQSETLNNRNVALVYQDIQRRALDGTTKTFGPHMLACAIAGMQSGTTVGEPLTFKYVNALDVISPNDIDPQDKNTSDLMLQNGILFCEKVQGKGFRVVRNMSTYTKDDNLAYVDRHINYELNFMSYDLRTDIENRFTGLKASAATVANLKGAVISKLEYYKNTLNIITNSSDPTTSAVINAYRNLKVTISGDIATIRFEIFPTTGINYLTFEIFAQLPTITG